MGNPFLRVAFSIALMPACVAIAESPSISGRYPHLATYNKQGECGIGAVVPWADRLWVITYGPHLPKGSDDKLYEIDADLNRTIRPESVGGTPANRMIHNETDQLIIGPYFIDKDRNVRVISPSKMPGRLTAAARHLTDPANRLYIMDMEGMLYDIDAHTLDVKKIFDRMAVGAHCKGGYTAQGRLVISNNGNIVANKATPALNPPDYKKDPEAAGVLAEWDGTTWTMDEARQFTEITGPGGITGSSSADSPLWALGWDKRSVILKLLDGGKWQTFRLPIADLSYMPKHGWYTEWPRIRDVGHETLLMNMHGGWFEIPKTFSAADPHGIRPIGNYLKITGDFCGWKDRIVFGCDDASLMENPLCTQSQSNLWFTNWNHLRSCGEPSGEGGVWVHDKVKAGVPSDRFLVRGYNSPCIHLANGSDQSVIFSLLSDGGAIDKKPTVLDTFKVEPHSHTQTRFGYDSLGEWVRVQADVDCADATAYFTLGTGGGAMTDRFQFTSLEDLVKLRGDDFAALHLPKPPTPTETEHKLHSAMAATVRPLGQDPGSLWFACGDGTQYEVTPDLKVQPYSGKPITEPKSIGVGDAFQVSIRDGSVLVTEGKARYRLPISSDYNLSRPIREVVTERFLLNAGGSFFMLPYPLAGGARGIKPICTHDKRITDFCSWRGLMVLAGTKTPVAKGETDLHAFRFNGNGPGVWLGDIDDLWSMGMPRGIGYAWFATDVKAGDVSDPYLMAGYGGKTTLLSHDSTEPVEITLEVDFLADGTWQQYKTLKVPPATVVTEAFPIGYSAHWVRAKINKPCKATVRFDYE